MGEHRRRGDEIDDREMVIDAGRRDVRVDTEDMPYDPFQAGLRPVREGKRVSVYGNIDDADLFEGREIDADAVIVLDHDPVG